MKLLKVFLVLTLTTTIFVNLSIANEKNTKEHQTVNSNINNDRPTQAVYQFFLAHIKKDVELLKKRVPYVALVSMQKAADKKKITLDEMIKQYLDSEPFKIKKTPLMQKVNTTEDKGTLEVYIGNKWEEIPLVKESKTWRVDVTSMK